MSLIRRTFLLILLVALIALPALSVALNTTLNSGLAELEKDEANQFLDRSADALNNRIEEVVSVARSFSRSDATYLYAASPNQFFVDDTFANRNFLDQQVNLIAVVNGAGEILHSRLINLVSQQDIPLTDSLNQALRSPALYQHSVQGGSEVAVDSVFSGLLSVEGQLMMVASTPIVTSQNTGPIRGAVITGRYLDAAENAALIAALGYSLHVRGTADPIFTSALQDATFNTASNSQLHLFANSDGWNWAFRPLLDVFGQPVGALHLEVPRQIDAIGSSIFNSIVLVSLAVTAIAFGAIVFFMRAAVVKPIAQLSQQIQRLRERGSLTERLPLVGQTASQNEVGQLGTTINAMLASLEQAQQRVNAGESRYQLLFDKSPVAYVLWGKDLKVQAWNDYAEHTFGWSADEVMGKRFIDFMIPEQSRPAVDDVVKLLVNNQLPSNQTNENLTKGRGFITCEWHNQVVRDENGEFVAVLSMAQEVTEKLVAERKLRDSNNRLEAALEGASLGLWDWNMVSNEVDYSDRWMSMLGYEPGELVGVFDTFASLVHPDDLNPTIEKVNAYLSGAAAAFMTEIRLKHKSGDYHWVLTSGKVAGRDANGKPTRMVGVHLDIHQQKQAETALREVEQRYRAIADFAPIAITALDKDGKVIHSEGTVFASAGFYSEDLLGKAYQSIYADNPDALKSIEQALQGGLGSFAGKLADVDYDAYAIPMADEAGDPNGAITLSVDVSKVKQAEQVLRENEARLRAIMSSAPLILFGMDEEGVINLTEGQALETVGLKAGDLMGVNIRDMYELMPDVQAKLDRALKGESLIVETPMGDTILENRYAPVIDHSGKVNGIINIGLDVTDRKRIERERERVVRELEDALLFKDQFLATMSHELRTPLNAVLGYSGIATMQYELPPQVVHMMERIKMNSKRLLNLINDILDISRINANRVEIVQRPVQTATLARGWHEDFGEQMRTKGLEFNLEIDPTLPETIIGDEERLSQIAHNLINNALKFTENGSINLAVRKQDDATWSIAISDTGVGIPDTWHHLIFDEFRQVDGTSKRKYGGAGLGLSIVQKLCRLMGGNIRVASKVGEGSTFTVTLPLRLPEAEVASA
jgi:PAS domain S-box-containing protein